MAGISESKILVSHTTKEVRFCSCETCGGNFRAIGEAALPKTGNKPPKAGNAPAKTDKEAKPRHNDIKEIKKVKPKKTRKKRAKAPKKAKKEVNNEQK